VQQYTKIIGRTAGRRRERGVALLTTLLLLMLVTGLSLAMVMAVRSDLLVNGYYRNFRGAFYAADSGLNIVRHDLATMISGMAPASFSVGTQPIPAGSEATILTNINSKYGTVTAITGSGNTVNSWPESFKLDTTQTQFSLANCTVNFDDGTTSTNCGLSKGTGGGNPSKYTYIYSYTIQTIGQAQNSERAIIEDRGNITLTANIVPAGTSTSSGVKTSFAAWGMFIDKSPLCNGSTLVAGTISGPVFTNDAWNFGTGSYIFTDNVGSVNPDSGFQYGSGSGGCDPFAGTADAKSGKTTNIKFQNGFQQGANSVPLPQNDFSQKRAVLDGQGTDTSNVGNSDLANKLRDVNKASYPGGGASSGVFLPYDVVSGTPTFKGGGIYVEGDASVVLQPGAAANQQTYTITQTGTTTITQPVFNKKGQQIGTTTVTVPTTTTTVVTVNKPLNSTDPGSTVMSQTYNVNGTNQPVQTLNVVGVPESRDPSGSAISPATMLYVDGNITSLSGPGVGQAAIQDGAAVTITAANNVTVTGDILYKTAPVTKTQNQVPNTPADTLIPGADNGQVLGIFTAGGNINLNNQQGSTNLEIDASLATISATGSGALINNGSAINTLTILGGRIQNTIQNINSSTRNVFFDRRFLSHGFAPPWFPSTTVTPTSSTTVTADQANFTSPVFQRVQWLYKANTY